MRIFSPSVFLALGLSALLNQSALFGNCTQTFVDVTQSVAISNDEVICVANSELTFTNSSAVTASCSINMVPFGGTSVSFSSLSGGTAAVTFSSVGIAYPASGGTSCSGTIQGTLNLNNGVELQDISFSNPICYYPANLTITGNSGLANATFKIYDPTDSTVAYYEAITINQTAAYASNLKINSQVLVNIASNFGSLGEGTITIKSNGILQVTTPSSPPSVTLSAKDIYVYGELNPVFGDVFYNSLILYEGGSLTNGTNSTVTATGTASTINNSGTIDNSGTITADTIDNSSTIDNSGTITAVAIDNSGTIDNRGTITAVAIDNSGIIDNNGTITADAIDNGIILINRLGATITAGEITDFGIIDNYGTIDTASMTISQYGILNDHGTVDTDTMIVQESSNVTINGIVNSTTPLNIFGSVKGTGTINGDVTVSGSTASLQGGNSPGTLTINGDLIVSNGATVIASINPTEASLLDITGTATLEDGAILQLQPESGCYGKISHFELLNTSGGLTGTFSEIELNSLILTPHVSYTANGVELNIIRNGFSTIVQSGNALAVARAIDASLDGGNIGELCTLTGSLVISDLSEITYVLNQLQPSLFTALSVAQENNAVRVRDSLTVRMQEASLTYCNPIYQDTEEKEQKKRCKKETKSMHVWLNGLGDSSHQNSTPYEFGYQDNMAGAVLGVDYHFANYFYAGALGAYTDDQVKWSQSQGKGHIQSGYGGLYFSFLGDLFYGNAAVLGGRSHYDTHRTIHLPSESLTASNKHGGAQILSHLDAGVNLQRGWINIRPFDSFDYISQTQNAFTESGASELDLSVKKNNAIMIRNELGLNFIACFCHKGSRFSITPKISWVREVRIKGAKLTAHFESSPDFEVTGYFPDRSLVSPGVTLEGNFMKDLLSLSLYYNGEFKGNYSNQSYGGQIRFGF